MSEAQPAAPGQGQGGPGPAGALGPKELEKLTEIVYRLMKDEILRNRERRGESMAKRWR